MLSPLGISPDRQLTARSARSGGLLLLALTALVRSDAHVRSQDWLIIDRYELVAERIVARNTRELTYRARLTNRGAAIKAATASASAKQTITIVDGALSFGPVAGGASVLSADTFSFLQNAHGPVRLSDIRWTITPASNVAPVADAGPDRTAAVFDTVTPATSGVKEGLAAAVLLNAAVLPLGTAINDQAYVSYVAFLKKMTLPV